MSAYYPYSAVVGAGWELEGKSYGEAGWDTLQCSDGFRQESPEGGAPLVTTLTMGMRTLSVLGGAACCGGETK